jgi:uncharacterized protein
MNTDAKTLIEKLQLIPHIEGGYYRQIYRATDIITPPERYSGKRCASTSIYYLLNSGEFSTWHRLQSDELWHFYCGCPLTLYVLDKNKNLQTYLLGNPLFTDNAQFQIAVPANHWMAAAPNEENSFTLVSCTVAPGFEFEDFELADREELIKEFSVHKTLISKFLRE